MRKASTRLPEQGTQAPSPAPDLIPAETQNQPRTYREIGTVNRGTSPQRPRLEIASIRGMSEVASHEEEYFLQLLPVVRSRPPRGELQLNDYSPG